MVRAVFGAAAVGGARVYAVAFTPSPCPPLSLHPQPFPNLLPEPSYIPLRFRLREPACAKCISPLFRCQPIQQPARPAHVGGGDRLPGLEAATGEDCTIAPGRARYGDLMAIEDGTPIGCSLGICNGERILVRRPEGMGTLDRRQAFLAWRLG